MLLIFLDGTDMCLGMFQSKYKCTPKKKKKTQKALNALYLRDRDGSLGQEINMLRTETNDLLDSEEIVWHLIKSAMVGPWRWQTQSIFTQKLLRERRNTPSPRLWMKTGIGVNPLMA